jgi:hypothetical protein
MDLPPGKTWKKCLEKICNKLFNGLSPVFQTDIVKSGCGEQPDLFISKLFLWYLQDKKHRLLIKGENCHLRNTIEAAEEAVAKYAFETLFLNLPLLDQEYCCTFGSQQEDDSVLSD